MDRNRILLVEDEPGIGTSLLQILKMHGLEAVLCDSGKDALTALEKDVFNLVLCDVNLPDFSGYEILKQVRENHNTSKIPFIFLTAYADEADVRKGMNLGADDYITKPFSAKSLVEAIHTKLAVR